MESDSPFQIIIVCSEEKPLCASGTIDVFVHH